MISDSTLVALVVGVAMYTLEVYTMEYVHCGNWQTIQIRALFFLESWLLNIYQHITTKIVYIHQKSANEHLKLVYFTACKFYIKINILFLLN